MDPIEQQLQDYYEAEATARLRPDVGERRRLISERFATQLRDERRWRVIDVGAGPGSDHASFAAVGVGYLGVDLAVGNAVVAAGLARTVVPASLFELPFAPATFPAGWSMSTFQHVPDRRIDAAMAEFVRVLEPGAPVTIGMWGGRDEIIESASSSTGVALPRHFTLRTHDRIRSILDRHLVVEEAHTFAAGPSDWEYHVASARTRT